MIRSASAKTSATTGGGVREFAPHVRILTPLSGEHEGDFAGFGAGTPEETLRLHRFPRRGIVEPHRFLRFVQAVEQFIVRAEVNDQAFGGAVCLQKHGFGGGEFEGRRPAGFDAGEGGVEGVFQVGGGGSGEGENAAEGFGG